MKDRIVRQEGGDRDQQRRAPGRAGSTSDLPRTILSMALAVTLISIPKRDIHLYIHTYILTFLRVRTALHSRAHRHD